MDLRRLEIFVKVAELGSFSRAAEALFLTQPTVSEHVRGLEDELGVQLLDRLGRGTTPTRAGVLLLGYARRLLALAREAGQAIEQFQGRVSGELTIGGSSIPGEYVVPALIGAFRGKHPDVRISLLIGSSREVEQWVEEGRVEIGVVGAPPSGRMLEGRQLMADEIVVVVGAEHPWAAPVGGLAGGAEGRAHDRARAGVGLARDASSERWRAWGSTSAPSVSSARWPRPRRSSRPSAPASASRSSPAGRSRTNAVPGCSAA